jgi:hypothetical protein
VTLIALTVDRSDSAAYIRGKLFMAGVDARTPLCIVLDVLTVLSLETPVDELRKWRKELDAALWRAQPPDRDTWGLRPEHQAQTERLMRGAPG